MAPVTGRTAPPANEPTGSTPRVDLDLEAELQRLREFVHQGWGVMNHRLYLDLEEFDGRVDDLMARLPNEVRRAKRITREEQRIIEDAKEEARRVLEEARAEAERVTRQAKALAEQVTTQAREEAQRMVETSSIRQRAVDQAEEILARAESASAELKTRSYAYAQQVVGTVEQSLKRLAQSVEQDRAQLDEMNPEPAPLAEPPAAEQPAVQRPAA